MKLYSGAPFWLIKNGIHSTRPALTAAARCDVVIWGAGVTGALIADRLSRDGLDVIVLDRRVSGAGSTAASTALIQYEIDQELVTLGERIGSADAARAYGMSVTAVERLGSICRELGAGDFRSRQSLYLASTRRDAARLQRETAARSAIGIAVSWLSRDEVESVYGFSSYGAIRSELAGEVDALALTRGLLERAVSQGARWYEQTHVRGYEERADGVRVLTSGGATVDARYAVCATGYDLPSYFGIGSLASLHSTYALVTERILDAAHWHDQVLVWESARPYCYMRTTADQRIIIGGEDTPFESARLRDRLLPGKIEQLEQRLANLLPAVRTETAFGWAGTFAETPDGLPYIGTLEKFPGVLFALGYGGNGITFSVIAAELLGTMCSNREPDGADLYRLSR